MAEQKKQEKVYLADGYTVTESINRHLGLVVIATVGGGVIGYLAAPQAAKLLGIEETTARWISTIVVSIGAFGIATIVAVQWDAAMVETALEAEREVLGTDRKTFEAMSRDERALHIAKQGKAILGGDLAEALHEMMADVVSDTVKRELAQFRVPAVSAPAQPIQFVVPQGQQPAQQPTPTAPQPTPTAPKPTMEDVSRLFRELLQPLTGLTHEATPAPAPDLAAMLGALSADQKAKLGGQLMAQANAAKRAEAATGNGS